MIQSVLDLFILSLIDRGLQTPYDLNRQGGLSLGSTLPALRKLAAAGLIRKEEAIGTSKRPRHTYQLSGTGRTKAREGWKKYLKTHDQMDLDAVLRVTDMAQHYNSKVADVVGFLEALILERKMPRRSSLVKSDRTKVALGYKSVLVAWNAERLKSEAKFLATLTKSIKSTATSRSKR